MDIRVLTWRELKAAVEIAGVQDDDPVDSLVVSGYAPPENLVAHRVPGPAGESHRIRCGSYLLKGLLEAELGMIDLPESDDFLPLEEVGPGEVQSEDRLENSAEVTHANGPVTKTSKDQIGPNEAWMAEGDRAKGALFFRATYRLVFQELWHCIDEEAVEFVADDGTPYRSSVYSLTGTIRQSSRRTGRAWALWSPGNRASPLATFSSRKHGVSGVRIPRCHW